MRPHRPWAPGMESTGQSGKLVQRRLGQRAATLFFGVGVPNIDLYTTTDGLMYPLGITRKCLVRLPLGTQDNNQSHSLCNFWVPGPVLGALHTLTVIL